MQSTTIGTPEVSVVIIAYDDAEHVEEAVLSALRQGPAVAEVIAVDDASGDDTGRILDRLARREARVRVVHRTENSGGCGTPRNTGLAQATAPWVMFLDSDDVLGPGAVDRLLAAARRHGSDVAAGACVRRELPDGREATWQPQLFTDETCHEDTSSEPALVWDTLSVNKLYARDFLDRNGIRFPDGAFHYEDFVFTARLLAAAARMAVVPDPVYLWNVRRDAARLSLSLDRGRITNWRSRLAAQRLALAAMEEAGRDTLADAARTKFLDHDLRMYLRELPRRSRSYRQEWWTETRAFLTGDPRTEQALARASAPARWAARVLLAADGTPRDIDRLAALAARSPRLLPPHPAGPDGAPVWSADLPIALDGIEALALDELPVTVEAQVRPGSTTGIELRIHDVYGRLRDAAPQSAELELTDRATGAVGAMCRAPLAAPPAHDTEPARPGERRRTGSAADTAGPAGVPAREAARATAVEEPPARERPSGRLPAWTAHLDLDLARVAASRPNASWDVRVHVRCAGGDTLSASVRSDGTGLARVAAPHPRRLLVLLQPYVTHDGSLAFRTARGLAGALRIARARAGRVLGRRSPSARRAAADPARSTS
ncbi:glycosyltransferase [Streptomyces sp. NPDC002004]